MVASEEDGPFWRTDDWATALAVTVNMKIVGRRALTLWYNLLKELN
jgi:hypothetical protein